MRLLLDTHTFLWTLLEPERLPLKARSAIENPASEVYVSAISLWEIAIKERIGKINLIGLILDDLLPFAETMGFLPITLAPDEAVIHGKLTENTHFDPFDRMLIWQAISRKMILISGDAEFNRFKPDGLKLLWK
jgi:PIN domain nuclease of toxin-antitoxin system